MPLHDALFCEPNPAPAKAALAILGLCKAEVRSPLLPATKDAEGKLRAALIHAGLMN